MVLDRRARNDESWKQKKLRTPDYLPARRNGAMTVPVVAPAVFGSWPTNERARPSIRTHDSGRETTGATVRRCTPPTRRPGAHVRHRRHVNYYSTVLGVFDERPRRPEAVLCAYV